MERKPIHRTCPICWHLRGRGEDPIRDTIREYREIEFGPICEFHINHQQTLDLLFKVKIMKVAVFWVSVVIVAYGVSRWI